QRVPGGSPCSTFPVSGTLLQGRQPMTDPLRIVVLAALTVFVVSSFSTGSAVAQLAHEQRTRHAEITCENSKDCPVGDRCKFRPHHKKTGICVGASSSAKKKYR